MGAEIKAMFFTDKLRSIVSALFMLTILVLIAGSWAFPRQTSSNLDEKSLSTLQEVSKQLKSAADNFERQANESAQLRESLNRTLEMQKGERDDVYVQMLKRYGLDPNKLEPSGAGYPSAAPPPSTIINVGMLPPDDGKRSVDISTGTSHTGRDRQLPGATGKNQGRSDGGASPVPAGGPEAPH
jgi:hypothetical protein